MRTTIRLDEHLLREAKRAAADRGQTLTALIEHALRETLARRGQQPKRKRVELITSSGALLSGVDLNNSAALLDMMEAPDDPPGR